MVASGVEASEKIDSFDRDIDEDNVENFRTALHGRAQSLLTEGS